jgi:hypothetical protein
MNMDAERLRTDFFGCDPLLGDRALKQAVATHGEEALSLLVPLQHGSGASSAQIKRRLAKLAAATGPRAIDRLVNVIRHGDWHSGSSAAPAFAGLRQNEDQARHKLVDILKNGEVDSQRHAIEALGFLGASATAFSITEFAQYGVWPPVESRYPNQDCLEKFATYTVQALVRMTEPLIDPEHIERCLRVLQNFLPVCEAVLGTGRLQDWTWDLRETQHHLPARAADGLIRTWIASDSAYLQERGFDALGHLRLNRTVDLLIDTIGNTAASLRVRTAATASLSHFADSRAAAALAKRLRQEGANAFGYSAAFAALYAHDVGWPECDEAIDQLLAGSPSETAAHMTYSLACRGDGRAEQSFAALDSNEHDFRAYNALACARFDAKRAHDALRKRDEEANSPFEHACILAAQVHAGDVTKLDSLHEALTTCGYLPLLPPTWKREVLYAFFVAEGDTSERGKLWCEAALEKPERVLGEMRQLLQGRSAPPRALRTPAPAAEPAPALPAPADHYDVFISHASEDKKSIAEPLYHALVAAGVRVWFDKTELKLGDKLRRKIDDGLARCRYGIVILSPSFLSKEWPRTELDGLMARETASGTKAILPVWHQLGVKELLAANPTLADRLACRSSEGVPAIVAKIQDVLKD